MSEILLSKHVSKFSRTRKTESNKNKKANDKPDPNKNIETIQNKIDGSHTMNELKDEIILHFL